MIENYINKKYINNYSDIISFSKDIEFKKIVNKLNKNCYIKINNHLIHKSKYINQYEQFIFNLDNYITFLKQFIFINNLELRYIINLTIYNKYNKIFYSNKYYYDNICLFHKYFINMFMYNYKKNYFIFSKYINNINPIRNFEELISNINLKKKRLYVYFENINLKNINFYLEIYNNLENIN